MPLNKKYFIYYCRVSVSEGLNIDLNTSQLMLGKYNKEVYQKCEYYCCVTEIKKGFKKMHLLVMSVLNFYKIKTSQINQQIHIVQTENQKYRAFTNFHCSLVDRVFRHENIKDKFGEIPQEIIDSYLNACELGTIM